MQMSDIDKRKLTAKIVKSKELTALEKRYIENLLQHTRAEFTEMSDAGFMAHIIAQICDYAVANEMPPTDTVRTLAENLTLLCEIADFDRWEAVSNVGKDTENR
jgi:predicted polyphosphate/ATP-dependent NAD kinase